MSSQKICKNCKNTFTIEPDDFAFYENIGVLPPTLCWLCRFQRRLLFRNERHFYKRNCDLCKKDIIACYPKDFQTPVYCQKCWWGDGWDPLSYGMDYDSSRSFIDQFRELFYKVPMISIMNDDGIASVNSQYSYDYAFSKNVYLCVCGWYMENALYTYHTDYGKEVMDCMHTDHAELCYELITSDNCSRCQYGQLMFDCLDCFFGYDLRHCSDCLFCVGLRGKKYCIWNEQYSKGEYEKKKSELGLEKRENLERYAKEFDQFALNFPKKYAHLLKTADCTGDLIRNGKNSKYCFYANNIEDCKYIVVNDQMKDCYDCNNTGRPKKCYESVTPDDSYGNIATLFCWKCNRAEYSNNCHSCMSVLGCSGLKKGSYCILNKQYAKEAFDLLRTQIVTDMKRRGEWGEFFPADMSPFAYNETAAKEWFPMTKKEAEQKGYQWKEQGVKKHAVTKISDQLPQTIDEVGDDILQEIIGCAHEEKCNDNCTKAFRIVPNELQIYKQLKIPLPILCPNCRHYRRLSKKNPIQLWDRKCDKCGVSIKTSYSPDRPEIVYCESCYNNEIL